MRYVALLRGINVGGNNKVEMKKLKKTFEDLGFTSVRTYINSGNVIFDTSDDMLPLKIEGKIEAAILADFGFPIRAVIRTQNNIQEIAAKLPQDWENNSDAKSDILFLWPDFDSPESLNLIKINTEVDVLKYLPGAIVWHIERSKYSKSGMNKFIGTPIYKNSTARNINTVRKLADMMSD